MQLPGFHHLTAITADARGNHDFFTRALGMRLVKKTVNQDDVSAYHLFYADGKATPGTDVTFFDWPMTRERRGTHSIVRTGLRVGGADSLRYWRDRLHEFAVRHGEIADRDGRPTLDFEDPEGQRLSLTVDDAPGPATLPWEKSPVPAEHQVRGLGPIMISVPDVGPTDMALTRVMGMRHARDYTLSPRTDGSAGSSTVHVYEMTEGAAGVSAQLHVAVEPDLPTAGQGAGGVHHVAFRAPTDEAYRAWVARLADLRVPNSGPVDRFYFKSLYFREPNGILFEIATDGPGFATDEPMEQLGERLALPPFLEPRREQIKAGLRPL